MKKDKYLVLNEGRNALDYLIQSLIFLAQVEQNPFYLKWFIISFHSAVYAFMLLVLQGQNYQLIYKILPQHLSTNKMKKEFDHVDGKLISFRDAYKYLKNSEKMAGHGFTETKTHNRCITELNNKLRNQLIHFKPMVLAYKPWYPARVCKPLLDILNFCIKDDHIQLDQSEKDMAFAYLESIDRLLIKHAG